MFRTQKWSMAFVCLLLFFWFWILYKYQKGFAPGESGEISICCLQPVPVTDADPQGLLGPRDTKGLQTGLGRWRVSFSEGTAGEVVREMPALWLLWQTVTVHCDYDPLWSCSLLSWRVDRYHFFQQLVKPLTDKPCQPTQVQESGRKVDGWKNRQYF